MGIKIDLHIEFNELITAVKDVYDLLNVIYESTENKFLFDNLKFTIGFNDVDEELPTKLFGLYDFLSFSK